MIYAVNKRTKEHRVALLPGCYAFDRDWEIVHADPDGWIEWQEGDGNPLPEDTRCDVMLWERKVVPNVIAHSNASWGGVTHYRPILDADTKPEPPAWDGEGLPPAGAVCEAVCSDGEWHKVSTAMVNHSHHVAVFECPVSPGLKYYWQTEGRFRPIRSEEDCAVEKMERIIANAVDVAYEDFHEAGRDIYNAVRDGKVPGVKLAAADGED